MANIDSTYSKPFLTVPEQISQLRSHGLECGSDEFAASVLERFGYYRLSGYFHPYRKPAPVNSRNRGARNGDFVRGASLAQVVELYEFDRMLREKVSAVISTIEISFRFFLGHRLGARHPFAHRRPELLGSSIPSDAHPPASYVKWLREYDRQEGRSQDSFVLHFREHYGKHLPVWVGTEVMGFGVLNGLYRIAPDSDREVLAARFQILARQGRGNSGALANWLNHLRHVRNVCAHNGRLWNRTLDVLIEAPSGDNGDHLAHVHCLSDARVKNKIYGSLVIMRHLLLSIDPDRTDVIKIINFVRKRARRIGFSLGDLGFSPGWSSEPLWQPGFRLPRAPMIAASLLDRIPCSSQVGIRTLLVSTPMSSLMSTGHTQQGVPTGGPAARRHLLTSYRKYRAVIEIELAEVRYFPDFQFRDGAIINALAEINQTFARMCPRATPERLAQAQLGWWQTTNECLPRGSDGAERSPLSLLTEVSESEFTRAVTAVHATESFVPPTVCTLTT